MAEDSKQPLAARYRRVPVSLWGDEAFNRLSAPKPNAQTLYLYIATGPHTTSLPGLANVGPMALAEALGWSPAATNRCIAELEQAGLVKFDRKMRLTWMPGRLDAEPPANENVVKGYRRILQEMPACPLRDEAEATIKRFCERLGKPLPERLGESGAVAVAVAVAVAGTETGAGARASVPGEARAAFVNLFRREPTEAEEAELVSWLKFQPAESIAAAINCVGESKEPVLSPWGLIRKLVTSRPRGADMRVMSPDPKIEAQRRSNDRLLEIAGHGSTPCGHFSEDANGGRAFCSSKSRDGSGFCEKHRGAVLTGTVIREASS